jgi:hypothetical protein
MSEYKPEYNPTIEFWVIEFADGTYLSRYLDCRNYQLARQYLSQEDALEALKFIDERDKLGAQLVCWRAHEARRVRP